MSVGTDIELGEILGIGILLLVFAKEIQAAFSSLAKSFPNASQAVSDAVNNATSTPTVVGPASFIAAKGPLTAQQALAISTQLGQGTNFNQSPDKTQVWFFNGTFYNNPDGNVYNQDGTLAGPLASDAAFNAVNTQAVDTVEFSPQGT